MRLPSFIIFGMCASFSLATAALAASPTGLAPRGQSVERTDVVDVLAKAQQRELTKLLKKKTLTKEEQARLKELQKVEAKEKKEAEKKAKEARLKADKAEKEKKAAAAKAEKDKLAAKAKAEKDKKLAAQKAEKEKLAAAKAKTDKAKKEAAAKLAAEKKIASAKAAEERKAASAAAAEERKLAKAKVAEEKRLAAAAKAKAAEDARMAKLRAEEARRIAVAKAAEEARQAELNRLAAAEIVVTGNNGELRSEGDDVPKPTGLAALFGGSKASALSMRPETKALDAALSLKNQKKKPFQVDPVYEPQVVTFTGYPKRSIVVDTASHFLYLGGIVIKARGHGIAVGKDGLQYKGKVKVGDKQEWPRWIPTKEMQAREPKKYGQYAEGMPGGGQNPLGARAMYLYDNGRDTHLRIHGTIAPETIGTDSSNGCFRMVNEHVMDLYNRVKVGTEVYVL